jgi:hypothetical protein
LDLERFFASALETDSEEKVSVAVEDEPSELHIVSVYVA